MFKTTLNTWFLEDDLGRREIKVYEICITNKNTDKLNFDNLYKSLDFLEKECVYYKPTEYDVVLEDDNEYMYILYDIKYEYGWMGEINEDFKSMKKDLKTFLNNL